MKTLLVPCIAALTLFSACAKQSKTPRMRKAAASADSTIAPSDAAGLYIDAAKAADFAKTGQVSDADCQASFEQREPAVKIFQFGKDNSISVLDVRAQPGEVYYSFDHGSLVPQKDELKSTADRAYTYSIRRPAGKVRMHFASKDQKSGKVSESDQALAQISEDNAKTFLEQEYACSVRPVDAARVTSLALGSAYLSYAAPGAKEPKAISMNSHSADPLHCEAAADAVTISIGSGVKLTIPNASLDGSKKPVDKAELAFDGQKLDLVCEATAKRANGVVDGTVNCGNQSAGQLTGSFACLREASDKRQ